MEETLEQLVGNQGSIHASEQGGKSGNHKRHTGHDAGGMFFQVSTGVADHGRTLDISFFDYAAYARGTFMKTGKNQQT
ncbi:hypothetical protein J14TS5_44420 [Paenibacillus lautus]|nr:hypothetical protein J14TS5_44420 [Paenibacillus lautus]